MTRIVQLQELQGVNANCCEMVEKVTDEMKFGPFALSNTLEAGHNNILSRIKYSRKVCKFY